MNRKLIYRYGIGGLLGLALGAWAPATLAKWANPQLLLTPEQLQKNIEKPDWVVVDCRALEDYLKGHIPGAISLGKPCGSALRDPTSRVLEAKRYEDILGKVGISNASHVVFYHGDMKELTDASTGFWILEYLGHDKAYVLNGGLDAWRKAGLKLSDKPSRREATTFKVKVVANRLSSTDEIVKIARGQVNGVQLIDSRTAREYKGEDIRSVRGGHVPNTTVNISHLDTLPKVKDPKSGKMVESAYLDPDIAAKAFEKLDKNTRAVAYCQTGTRSTLTYLQFRLMGFKEPANWDDSWRVYGAKLEYPVADEQWYDFAKVNSELRSLEEKVKKLEAAAAKPSGK
jgi:thiosulfate/3-mercaptopyruvate sulfurtransferase